MKELQGIAQSQQTSQQQEQLSNGQSNGQIMPTNGHHHHHQYQMASSSLMANGHSKGKCVCSNKGGYSWLNSLA